MGRFGAGKLRLSDSTGERWQLQIRNLAGDQVTETLATVAFGEVSQVLKTPSCVIFVIGLAAGFALR